MLSDNRVRASRHVVLVQAGGRTEYVRGSHRVCTCFGHVTCMCHRVLKDSRRGGRRGVLTGGCGGDGADSSLCFLPLTSFVATRFELADCGAAKTGVCVCVCVCVGG